MKNIARCVGLENGQFIYAVIVQWAADRADSLMCAVLYEPCAAHSSVSRAQFVTFGHSLAGFAL